MWEVAFSNFGRDPFDQISGNCGLKLNGTVRSNRKSFEKSAHLSRLTTFFGWTGPIEMDRSIWPFRPVVNPSTSLFGIFHVQHKGKHLLYSFCGLLTADLSVLLTHPSAATTSPELLNKRENPVQASGRDIKDATLDFEVSNRVPRCSKSILSCSNL